MFSLNIYNLFKCFLIEKPKEQQFASASNSRAICSIRGLWGNCGKLRLDPYSAQMRKSADNPRAARRGEHPRDVWCYTYFLHIYTHLGTHTRAHIHANIHRNWSTEGERAYGWGVGELYTAAVGGFGASRKEEEEARWMDGRCEYVLHGARSGWWIAIYRGWGDVFVHSRTDAWIYSAWIHQYGHSGLKTHADRATGLCYFNKMIGDCFSSGPYNCCKKKL